MPTQGYVMTQVFTSNAILPVVDATVTISQKQSDGIMELVAVQLTDESGKTSQVPISAPQRQDSLEPNRKKPFSVVDIAIECPFYRRVMIRNAQIFADTVTLQRVQLIPQDLLPQRWNQTETVYISAQKL